MSNRAVPVAAAAAALLILAASGRPAVVRAQSQAAPGNATEGRTMYARAGCETCHGPDGRGTAAGPRLAATALQLPAFVAYTRKPTGTMPAQASEAVSDRHLADIHAFLRTAAPAAAAPAGGRVDVGAAVYRKVGCYQCHVNEGQGGANGPRIGPDPIPLPRFSQYVRQPSGDMPPYSERVLSDQDMADIHAFLQARPRPPALDSIPQLKP